jgi:CHAT domain-containing protein
VDLTTGTFEALVAALGIGRAAALRRSMLAMMADERKPYFAHPMFWAPFVVVSEGDANVQQTQ